MSDLYNPFDAIYANTERLRQLSANQAAGQQYAAGNYQGAANALATSGDVKGAQEFAGNQQEQMLRAAQVQAAQRAQQLEQLTHVSSYLATVHKQGGDVGKAIDTLAPVLGTNPQQLAQFKQMAVQDPGIFDVISGNAAKELEPYTLKQGESRFSGGKVIASVAPEEKVTPIPAGGSAYVHGGATSAMIPQGGAPPTVDPNAPPPAPAGDDAVSAYTYFVNKGYTPAQAAGIVGNLVQESSLNPNAHNPVDGGRGLGQWHGDRLAALQQFATQNGGNWQDRNTQLAFIDNELKGPESGALAALTSAGDDPVRAAAAFAGYERPKGWTPNGDPSQIDGWARRSGVARALYGQNGAPAPPASGGRIIQGNAKPLARPATAEEKAAYGLSADVPAQIKPDGSFDTLAGTAKGKARPATAAEKAQYGIAASVPAQIKADGSLDVISGTGANLKPVPPVAAGAYRANSTAIQQIDLAIEAVRSHPDAIGATGYLPDALSQRVNQGGVDTRARLANIGSVKLHDLSGAAVTPSEEVRFKPFIPNARDTPRAAITKLQQLRQQYVSNNQQIEAAYSGDNGYRPIETPTPQAKARANAGSQASLFNRQRGWTKDRSLVPQAQYDKLRTFYGTKAKPGEAGNPIVVTSAEEYAAIPSGRGLHYLDSDGVVAVKP